ncbi:MAG: efflux RND transporter permease subunit [Candidatus Tumulicola sp.]
MRLTQFSLRNPIAVTLFYALVALLGFAALLEMGRSILPPVSFPVVAISAAYPGASPREIERLIVQPIEDQLEALPSVDRVSVSAQDGTASIVVRFRFGSNLETDRSNVQQAVDAARANMPLEVVAPIVSARDPSQAPILSESVTSAVLSSRTLSELVEDEISPALRATNDVGEVRTTGETTRQLNVIPQLAPLNEIGGTSLDVLRAITAASDIFPGGRLRQSLSETTIGVSSAAENADALRKLPVIIPGAQSIRVADVARVVDGMADETTISRVDQQRAIVIYVSRAQGEDSNRAINAINETFRLLASRYPLIRFEQLRSDKPYTQAAIDGVMQTLGEGIVLTVVVMLLFLRTWRNAAISAIAIPASLLATFAAMWAAGFTVNVLSLMALSLTIGILVDDSIVIVEAITRCAQRGLQGEQAALAGRNELGGAAFAITLVDVAVFAPLAFMNGVVGEFMREFGAVIAFATTFSLVVSFTLTPLLAALWGLRPAMAVPRVLPWMLRTVFARGAVQRCRSGFDGVRNLEERTAAVYAGQLLPLAWKKRRLVMAAAALVCLASVGLLTGGKIPAEFSPSTSRGEATVDLTFPAGTPLRETDARVMQFSRKLLEDDRIAHTIVTAGRSFNGTSDFIAGNVAQIEAILTDPTASGDGFVDNVKAMQSLAPESRISGSGKGMGGTAPINYSVTGDPSSVDVAAERIEQTLLANRNATDVRASDAGLGPRLDIVVDPAKAVLLNVSSDDAARAARIATGGTLAAKVRLRNRLVNVYVQSDAAERGDIDAILRSTVRSNANVLVPLADLVSLTRSEEPAIVERENGQRVVSVTANTVGSAPIGLVTAPMNALLRDPGFLPPGAHVAPRGDVEQLVETVGNILVTLSLSVGIVYAILAILYRSYFLPLVIMMTVPFASIGAFGALFLTGKPLNLYSMLGIVMLVGIVAKNGILLVEYAEREVRRGVTATEAMRDAARLRFRPIVMTTLAMIAGMLPLALGHTIGAEYRQALGIVVIGGLASSLLLTLFLVPIVYMAMRPASRRRDKNRSSACFGLGGEPERL